MNRIILIIVLLACFGLIGWGVYQKVTEPKTIVAGVGFDSSGNRVTPDATPLKAELASDTAPVTSAIKNDVKRYYPDSGATVGSAGETTVPDSSRDFQITPTLVAKMYLADKYNPGICFGAPSSPPAVAVSGLINDQKALADFLREHYSLTSDLEVYNKIKQFQDITLTETASSQFNFKFMDGQCQNVEYYEGTVKVSGAQATDSVTLHESHTYN